ncbi:beta-lactamase superfamily domain protein [Rhodococcus sp. MTM3W5.2]|uniref:MBL fold metallo-hydrolase n=1 Tax=Rhodococcus sp. MTM3W5.2 TaxID=1805827 RepID=UPI0009791C52|nr:MBL fold metallo-hydrolase [Rhodococcus sp. MTM3W5.2]AQA24543.1 beta-lactamase superfamily domain protein [Rhodococcus sp. MTM3W5.2]
MTSTTASTTSTGSTAAQGVRAVLVGGPTLHLTVAGLSILTDPTFDEPGSYEGGVTLTKLTPPALPEESLGPIDLVLLSHDQHADNLDDAGRRLLGRVETVLSTPEAAGRLPGVTGLAPWDHTMIATPDGRELTVTAVPALHGPAGCEPITGTVTGFILSAKGIPTIYVSGDNASVELTREIGERLGPVDIAILFAGAADPGRFPVPVTLTSAEAVEVARILAPSVVIPVHTDGWAHFTEGADRFTAAFESAGLDALLHTPVPGTYFDI